MGVTIDHEGLDCMDEKWIGLIAAPQRVRVVGLVFGEPTEGKAGLFLDNTIELGDIEKQQAYKMVAQRVRDIISENGAGFVVIKSTAVTGNKATAALLNGAEVRGVVIASAAMTSAEVLLIGAPAVKSRIGSRTIEEYKRDDQYLEKVLNAIPKNLESREAALYIINARKRKHEQSESV